MFTRNLSPNVYYVILLFLFNNTLLFSQSDLISIQKIKSFGSMNSDILFDIRNICELPDGNLLLTDKLDYKVKIIDKSSNIITSVGKRGKSKGEFLRGPAAIDYNNDKIAVSDFALPFVHIYNKKLKFIKTINTKGSVFDLHFNYRGDLLVGSFTGHKSEEFFRYNSRGTLLSSIKLKNTTGDLFGDIFQFAVSIKGKIAIAYMVRNKIEILDDSGNFAREFSIPGIVTKPRSEKISGNMSAPDGNIVSNVAFDKKENIFVLGADYFPHPNRDIFVLNCSGKYITKFTIPYDAFRIFIGKSNYLYIIKDRHTQIDQYKIIYRSKP